jgi:hypothetical protein
MGSGTKAVIVLALLLGLVGSCGVMVWSAVGQHARLADEIRRASGGRAEFVTVVGFGGDVVVQIVARAGLTDAEADALICEVVLPRTRAAGLAVSQLSIATTDGEIRAFGVDPEERCPG